MFGLPQTVVVIGLVSLFTDISSEMMYPLLPAFLSTTLGASAAVLGLMEGAAETTAAVLKLVSGVWTDRTGRRKPLMLLGYSLSSVSRPLIGLAPIWPVVVLLRLADRVGKGLRSTPRDALIADVTLPNQRGAAYGLHRAMDHTGAVLGPLVAALLIEQAHLSVRQVFLWAAVPGALAVAAIAFAIHDPQVAMPQPDAKRKNALPWRDAPLGFKRFVAATALFTLGNSSDAFLLLYLQDRGVAPASIAVLWSLFHVVKMLTTLAGGRLSDIIGRKIMVLSGWIAYAAVYTGMALAHSEQAAIGLFLAYGIYFGLTEPVEKAWVADLVPVHQRGAAFGAWQGVTALGALPASLLFGALWKAFGVEAALGVGAVFALFAAALLLWVPARPDA